MKRQSMLLAAGLPYLVTIFVISVFPAELLSQNSAVRWSTFNIGFAMSASSNTVVKSSIGQGFVGTIEQGNTSIESGFFADTSIRRTIITSVKELRMPIAFLLRQNFPNPFNPTTTISYQLSKNSYVTLKIFDLLGREVKVLVDEKKNAGTFSVQFDARQLSSGIYFYRLTAESFIDVKKMLVVK